MSYKYINQAAFEKQLAVAIRMHNEMIEDSIVECLAWRMYGIDANWYYIQGEFTVKVNLSKHVHLTTTHESVTLFDPLNLKGRI